ncbi:MAG: glycerophosphodiester phosphodiesterase family protein [Methylocella sp.]
MRGQNVREINAPDWLTARPIAHRGLHCKARGLVENTIAAAAAAMAKGYAIECDIQRSSDGEAMVFHDFTLERLMLAEGRLDAYSAQEISGLRFRDCDQSIAPLADFLAAINGRVPLIVEIKSRFDGDLRLADRAIAIVAEYDGPVCLKSFDPEILAFIRAQKIACPLGLVAEARYAEKEWPELSPERRTALADLRDFSRVRPDFLSWHIGDLPHAVPELCRSGMGMPVITWTVRSASDRERANLWIDQIIFEGFEP